MIKILLTGAEGFIGRNIYEELCVWDNIHSVTSIEKDYMNYEGWETTLSKAVQDCNVILHVGAITDTMLKDPNEMMKYNFEFSRQLFDLACIWEKKVVYSSSAANKGDGGSTPSNLYGWSKYITEQYGRKVVPSFYALRYFNVYGPGEQDKGKMASVAFQAHRAGKFKLFPGNPKRDFVYIKDVVSATIHPIFSDALPGIYEVGSGEARTFENVLDLMGVEYDYRDESDIPSGYQYFTRAKKTQFIKGWEPIYSLEKGLKEYKEYLES
jgi:ADP-L-glycero-D-manno-heptose 6-epimerase